MDCYEVGQVVYQVIDSEVSIEVRQQVVRHLTDCPECDTAYEIERRVKILVSRACSYTECPASLEDRLRRALRELG